MQLVKRLRFSLVALSLVAHQATAAVINIAGTGQNGDSMGSAVVTGDFDCDGYDDLVIGVPGNNLESPNSGAINIIFGGTGSGAQLGTTNNQQIVGGYLGVQSNDAFGSVLAAGDLNVDGCDDIVIGIPLKDVGSAVDAGTVVILYGHWRGTGFMHEIWHQDTAGVDGNPEAGDNFGSSLATGDFNGDGVDDLAIGVSGEDSGAGWVYVMHGQALAGVTTAQDQFYSQGSEGIAGGPEDDDGFGSSLAAGDFNGDGYDDLVIGVPGEDWHNDYNNEGGAHILYGSGSSLSSAGSLLWGPSSTDNEALGHSLAAGDFNGDGYADLALAVPYDRPVSNPYPPGTSYYYGSVKVLYGSSTGVTGTGNYTIYPDFAPIAVGVSSNFGWALAAGDFNADGYKDLAIGAPKAYVNGVTSGMVQLLYGNTTGLTTSGTQGLHQNVGDVEGANESDDNFGDALASGDFNADGRADLVVGVPRDNSGGILAGSAQVFYGAAGFLNRANDQLFVQ
jgi:hypothetical protein